MSLDISTGVLSWVFSVVALDITNFKVVLGIPRTVWTSDISDVTTDFDWARDWGLGKVRRMNPEFRVHEEDFYLS